MHIERSTPPVVGSWYRRNDRAQPFRVVACDTDAETVDVEYFDGTVDEWPLTHWRSLGITAGEAPLDWSGPFDDLERTELEPDGAAAPLPGVAEAIRELSEGSDLGPDDDS